ncbi:DNA topoisomerase 3-alpha [Frankliniella fusca]|uniref:DNA topoisomerase 3-alpha n=1 Tax=Frankliniella fusca TaxID=407009 RepID=A0AAE1H1M1_9NEOP|nr:DNA topoisomerase 3-alpha [Frankliniella fusca]
MRHTIFDEEFQSLVEDLKETSSEAFFKYFEESWLKCPHAWCDIDKKKSLNYGNTTNNRVESFNSKIKKMINSHSTLAEAVQGLLNLVRNKEEDVFFKDVQANLKKTYLSNSQDQNIQCMLSHLTLYAAKLEIWEYEAEVSQKEMEYYKSTETVCECKHKKSFNLPCRHMFEERRRKGTPVFTTTESLEKIWLKAEQTNHPQKCSIALNEDRAEGTVIVRSIPAKKADTPLKKYQLADVEAKIMCNILSESVQFHERLCVLRDIIKIWSDGDKVVVCRKGESNINETVLQQPKMREIIVPNGEAKGSIDIGSSSKAVEHVIATHNDVEVEHSENMGQQPKMCEIVVTNGEAVGSIGIESSSIAVEHCSTSNDIEVEHSENSSVGQQPKMFEIIVTDGEAVGSIDIGRSSKAVEHIATCNDVEVEHSENSSVVQQQSSKVEMTDGSMDSQNSWEDLLNDEDGDRTLLSCDIEGISEINEVFDEGERNVSELSTVVDQLQSQSEADAGPNCFCNVPSVRRTGRNTSRQFWGCPNFFDPDGAKKCNFHQFAKKKTSVEEALNAVLIPKSVKTKGRPRKSSTVQLKFPRKGSKDTSIIKKPAGAFFTPFQLASQGRQERGQRINDKDVLDNEDGTYIVTSQTNPGTTYLVTSDSCTCPDSASVCKHIVKIRQIMDKGNESLLGYFLIVLYSFSDGVQCKVVEDQNQ